MGFVDSTSQVKFSAVSEEGLAFEVTRARIDTYIAEYSRKFKKSCKKYRKLLKKYNKMIVYCQFRTVPLHMTSEAECRCGSSRTFTFHKLCFRCLERAHYEVGLLVAHIKNLALEIRKSEKRSGIAYTNPRDHCLVGFNSMFASQCKVWSSFESLREYFENRQKEFVVDHFIQKSEIFHHTLYQPCLEKMMRKVARKYNKEFERPLDGPSSSWIYEQLFRKDRFSRSTIIPEEIPN